MRIRIHQFAWLAAVAVLALFDPAPLSAQKQSSRNAEDGAQGNRFVSPGQFLVDQLLESTAQPLNGLLAQKLAMPVRARVSKSSAPLKQVTLLGGDRITAEISKWQDENIELRLAGGQVIVTPRAAIVAVQTLDQETEVLYESFDQRAAPTASPLSNITQPRIDVSWIESPDSLTSNGGLNIGKATQPLAYEFPQPLSASRVQLWFRVGDSSDQTASGDKPKPPSALSIDFDFSTDTHLNAQMTTGAATVTSRGVAQDSLTTQRVALSKGWHCLTAALFADRALIIVDSALLASTNRSLGSLRAIRFAGSESVWINDLQVSQFHTNPDESTVRPSTQDDCLALSDGEQWFGRISQVAGANVVLADSTAEKVTTWPHITGFALRQSEQPASRPLSPIGLWATIELQANLDRRQQAADHITATIVHIDREFVIVMHPWLGRFAISWSQIARIEPRFFGQSLTLDGRRRHLGDAIREDFQRQIPDGTEWSVKFQLPPQTRLADGQAWLSLDVVDLEPAGPQTPPASPFLRELRAGQLLTRIIINNKPAGDLNRWIHYRAAPDHPERIRCLLPTGLLRVGENLIQLHQTPLKNYGARFDNCEISNLRLELIEPIR